MKDLLERGLVLFRDVTSLFEKADGERRNCPRCRGSGLLKRRVWLWESRSVGNEPCWFCEGVGVMPLFGLNGFMLGRATAAIKTEQLTESVNPPFQIHLCLGKYPDSQSKFSTYSPDQNLSSFLYKADSLPAWVTDAVEELAREHFEDSDCTGEELENLNIPGPPKGLKTPHSVASHSSLSAPSWSSVINGRFGKSSVKRLVSSDDGTLPLYSSVSLSDLDLTTSTVGKRRDALGGKYRSRMTRKANHTLNTPVISSFRQRIFEKSRISESKREMDHEMDSGLLSLASGLQFIPHILINNSTRRVKSARRRRNHIREKLEKETIQNTWRLRKLLCTKPEQHTSPDPSDALQNFSGSWKDLSQKCLAELTASSRQSNKPVISQLGPTAAYPSLVNQPFHGKLVGKLQLLPNIAKPLKW